MLAKQLYPVSPVALAIIAGATTPAAAFAGAKCWSSTLGCEMIWDGAAWRICPTYSAPITIGVATYTVPNGVSELIFNVACTVTLPAPASYAGRALYMKNTSALAVSSATANVAPIGSAIAGTAILIAFAAKWVRLVSNGAAWVVMAGN